MVARSKSNARLSAIGVNKLVGSSSAAATGLEDISEVVGWVAGLDEVEPVKLSKQSQGSERVIAGIFFKIALVIVEVGVDSELARARIGIARKAYVLGKLSRSRKISTTTLKA